MDKKLKWLTNSRAYLKAKSLVRDTLKNPQKLNTLLSNAQSKTTRNLIPKYQAIVEPINTAFRLLKAYASGEYREIPFESIALVVASFIYLVMPLDGIPDFILALGYTDDIALLTWTFRTIANELKNFTAWELNKDLENANIIEHETGLP